MYPRFAEHVAEFMAQTLFHTSTFKLDTDAYRCGEPPASGGDHFNHVIPAEC